MKWGIFAVALLVGCTSEKDLAKERSRIEREAEKKQEDQKHKELIERRKQWLEEHEWREDLSEIKPGDTVTVDLYLHANVIRVKKINNDTGLITVVWANYDASSRSEEYCRHPILEAELPKEMVRKVGAYWNKKTNLKTEKPEWFR